MVITTLHIKLTTINLKLTLINHNPWLLRVDTKALYKTAKQDIPPLKTKIQKKLKQHEKQ